VTVPDAKTFNTFELPVIYFLDLIAVCTAA